MGFEKSGRGLEALGDVGDALEAFIAAGEGHCVKWNVCASSRNRSLFSWKPFNPNAVEMSKSLLACAVKLRIYSRDTAM